MLLKLPLIKRISLILSIALLAISLTQKCYCTDSSTCGDSVVVFFLGAFGLMGLGAGCIGSLCWMANPALIMAWIFIKKEPKISLVLSGAAALLALLFFFIGTEWSAEQGGCHEISSFRAGYWLWLSSTLILFAGNLIGDVATKNKAETHINEQKTI